MIRRTFPKCALVFAAAISQEAGPVQAALQQRIGKIENSTAENLPPKKLRSFAVATHLD